MFIASLPFQTCHAFHDSAPLLWMEIILTTWFAQKYFIVPGISFWSFVSAVAISTTPLLSRDPPPCPVCLFLGTLRRGGGMFAGEQRLWINNRDNLGFSFLSVRWRLCAISPYDDNVSCFIQKPLKAFCVQTCVVYLWCVYFVSFSLHLPLGPCEPADWCWWIQPCDCVSFYCFVQIRNHLNLLFPCFMRDTCLSCLKALSQSEHTLMNYIWRR